MKKFKTILLLAIGIVLGSVGTFSINQMFEIQPHKKKPKTIKPPQRHPKLILLQQNLKQ